MSSNTKEGSSSGGSGGGLGSKLKGAAQAVHGLGESIRGTVLGAADTITHSQTGEAKHEEIASKGKAEFAEGMTKLRPGSSVGAGTAGTATGAGSTRGGSSVQEAESVGKGTRSDERDTPSASKATAVAGEEAREEGEAGHKEGTAEEETHVPSASQHSPSADTNANQVTYPGERPPPQPKSYVDHSKSTEQHEAENPEAQTKKELPADRPGGTGAEGGQTEHEQSQKWVHEGEGTQPKEGEEARPKRSERDEVSTGSGQSAGSSQGLAGGETGPEEKAGQETGKRRDLIGEGADAPQGPGSYV